MLKKILDSVHMFLHLLVGFFIAQIAVQLHTGFQSNYFLYPALFGSIVPDIDHLCYFFMYGRDDPYSKQVRKLLISGRVFEAISYCAQHHKELTSLYSHTARTIVIIFVVGGIFWFLHYLWWGVFLLAMVGHLLFDMLEDMILLGRLNKNWLRGIRS